ncbi:MAG: ATP-dependent DNA helicase [Methylococcaceae bacterium]|nr:ATP-dependent DNA helicase [Methylococcaceae bacterium]
MTRLPEVFSPDGLLAKAFGGFRPRQAQIEMALVTAEAIDQGGCLVVEAGTGTGKTLAYLVPAILSGKKVIVSTATKTLQDQLFRKDLPMVRRTLEKPIRTALLKGRGNYLCLYRLKHVLGFRQGLAAHDARTLEAIRRWARHTQTGDISEATDVPEQSTHWPSATSTVDNCLGQECPDYNDCFLVKARNRARDADILIINHHLLWADWTLRNEGHGELLPQVDAIIVDEAHQFLESAAQFLGASISSRQLLELGNDILMERLRDAPDVIDLLDEADRLERLTESARMAFGSESRRESWHAVTGQDDIAASFAAIREQLMTLEALLKPLSVRGKGIESCHKRCLDLTIRLHTFFEGIDENHVRWFETKKRGFSLNRTPLAVAEEFTKFRQTTPAAWIFASATLTVAGKFEHFTRQLGIFDARCHNWDSPFDYQSNCLLYLPQHLPDPGSREFNRAVVSAILPVLEATQGRAFFLFTSHQALNEAAQLLAQFANYPLFVQGSQPKTQLLESFKASNNGVLLGTSTFWEGVDVPGPNLSCVIIDKLPFASPADPVLHAKLEKIRRDGLNPFYTHQLPATIITLRQGVGRLIRDYDDRGVLVLCDPRLLSKPYGKVFLNSLPPMERSHSIADIQLFFADARSPSVVSA